jgi:hypothetical protein
MGGVFPATNSLHQASRFKMSKGTSLWGPIHSNQRFGLLETDLNLDSYITKRNVVKTDWIPPI